MMMMMMIIIIILIIIMNEAKNMEDEFERLTELRIKP
jgi:hypothetical protein